MLEEDIIKRNNHGKQSTLIPYLNQKNKDSIMLELKPYIQPFERILANAELAGLIEPGLIEAPFEYESDNHITISTSTPADLLKRRLAYWQRIGSNTFEPTLQVVYESSQDWSIDKNTLLMKQRRFFFPKQRRLRYGPHDIHEYRGKFFPQLVKALINSARTPEDGIVIDPMCGSGTTNCEARLMGMVTIGLDLNPLSVKIAKTKTAILKIDPEELLTTAKRLIQNIETSSDTDIETFWRDKDLEYLKKWFDENALLEICEVLKCLRSSEKPILKDLFEICLSNILRNISWQKSDDLRVRKVIREYKQGEVFEAFSNEIKKQIKKLVPFLSIIKGKVKLKQFDIREGDTRHASKIMSSWSGECNVLITSPPYATALPYIDTDRLSLIILGILYRDEHHSRELQMMGNREVTENQRKKLWEMYQQRRYELPEDICIFIDKLAKIYHKDTVGFRRRNLPALLSKYYLDMREAMQSSKDMMKPGSYGFFVVGNNSTKIDGKRLEIPTNRFLWEIGKKVGWKPIKLMNMELLASRDIFRKNRGTSETILVFNSGANV